MKNRKPKPCRWCMYTLEKSLITKIPRTTTTKNNITNTVAN